jgi:hypothetical protein
LAWPAPYSTSNGCAPALCACATCDQWT